MATRPHTDHAQHHPPTAPHPEPREETVAKALGEAERAQRGHAREELADPSTRRGLNRTMLGTAALMAGIGFAVGAVLGIVLSFVSGPFELVGRGNTEGSTDWLQTLLYALTLGGAFALVVGVIGTLLLLAREDGRVEREVEEKTGEGPHGPGRPLDPARDVRER